MRDFHDYLVRHEREGEPESGAFTLDPERARRQTLEHLRGHPTDYSLHFLASAATLGASEVRLFTSHRAARAFLARSKSFKSSHTLFADINLPKELLPDLPGALIDHSQPALQRLSWTLHQLNFFLQPKSLRVTSLQNGLAYTWIWWPTRGKTEWLPVNHTPYEACGLLIECQASTGKLPVAKRGSPNLELSDFHRAASWSNLDCYLDDRLLNSGKPEAEVLHFIPKRSLPGAELQAWLEAPPALSELIIVADGITLPAGPLSPQKYKKDWFPGVKLVLWLEKAQWDASKLQLVFDRALEDLVNQALKTSRSMISDLGQSQDRKCRHYILGNWHRFPELPLSSYPLFRTADEKFVSLDQIRTDQPTVETEDIDYSVSLRGFHHNFRFYRGGEPGRSLDSCPRGRWLALERHSRVSFHSTSDPTASHSPNLALKQWALRWHPSEPWVALLSEQGAHVWDLKLEKELAFFEGDFCSLGFSQYGRYLNLYEQQSPRRLTYWKVTLPDFERVDEPFEMPGRNPVAVGHLLLIWQDERHFQVRHFADLSVLIQEFFTDEPASQLLDTSPCYGLAVLGGERASYLYDMRHQTLRKLELPVQKARFSWSCDHLFITHRNGHSKIELTHLHRSDLPGSVLHFFRSGLALVKNSSDTEPLRVSVLEKTQPSVLQDATPLYITQEHDSFPRLMSYSEESEPRELLRFGTSQAAGLRCPKTSSTLLALSCPGGSRLHNLGNGSVAFAPNCVPLNFRLVRLYDDGAWLLDPDTFEPHLGSFRGKRFELVYRHPEYLIVTNENDQVTIIKSDRVEELDYQLKPDSNFNPSDRNRLPGHPDTFVCVRSGKLAFGRVDPQTLQWIPITSPFPFEIEADQYSLSSNGLLAAVSDWLLTIVDLERRELLARLPYDGSVGPLAWLSENHLNAGSTIWRASPEKGWSSPRPSYCKIPGQLVHLPETELCIEEHGPEHRLFHLNTGATVAVYRSLAEHWFLFTPNGEWDGSAGCLNFLHPTPDLLPTHNLLGKIAKTYTLNFNRG